MAVQPGLCRTRSETRRPVFSERGSNITTKQHGMVLCISINWVRHDFFLISVSPIPSRYIHFVEGQRICNVSRLANKPRQWKSMLIHHGWFNLVIYATFTPTTNYRVCNLHVYLYPTPRCHITSPSEKSRPETWPGNIMGKATPVWQLTLSHRCHQM